MSKVELVHAADKLGKVRDLEVELIKVRYIDAAELRSVYLGQ